MFGIKIKNIIVLSVVFVVSCSPSPEVTQDVIDQSQESMMTETITVTFTDTPNITDTSTSTVTLTLTPTETITPTISVTQIPKEAFQSLDGIFKDVVTNIGNHVGKPIKIFIYEPLDLDSLMFLFMSPDYELISYVNLKLADQALVSTRDLHNINYGWVYGVISGTFQHTTSYGSYERLQVEVVDIDVPAIEYAPKEDGLYLVGKDIASGQWKSSYDKTTSGCYWARIADEGDIIANHFGIAGVTVRVLDSDTVVEFNGCGTMYYLGE